VTSRVVSASVQLANLPLLTLTGEKKLKLACSVRLLLPVFMSMSRIRNVDRGKPQMTSGDIYTGCSLTAVVIREEIKQHPVS